MKVWVDGRAYNLPDNPNIDDTVVIGNRVWTWDGEKWVVSLVAEGAAGADTQVQWNNAGAFAGSPNFTWNNGTQVLSVAGDINIVDPGGTDGYSFRINGVPLDLAAIYSWGNNVNANNNSITNLNSINGNPVGNFVLTTGSYANPAWITSLDWSKIANAPSFLTDEWTSDVDADGHSITNLTNINGNPVANIVLTTGSYANPAWITSLAWSKITGAPTSLVQHGDAPPATANDYDLWFDTLSLSLFIRYEGAWVGI